MSSQLETDIVAMERVEEYCRLPNEAPEILPFRPSREWPHRGAVCFDEFSVRYREGLGLVLRDVSVTIRPSEKVGMPR